MNTHKSLWWASQPKERLMSIRNETAGSEQGPITTGLKRVVAASMAGTVVEWYEFFLYATAATLVFNKVFFSQGTSESKALIAALLTYAVGFVARPLGGVVFGHFGDKYGRKKLLQFSLLLVGAVTFLMGCLPTYLQIGVWAPTLLVVLRFLQGFAVGGEWGGAVLLVAEHSPNRSRAYWASWPQAAVPVGNMLATVVLLTLTNTLSEAAFLSWGWRVGFWLSAVVVLIGYYIRTKVTDAPIFVAAQQEVERVKAVSYGVIEVLKRYPRGVFTAMGLRFAENIMYYLVVTFSIVYLKKQVGADTSDILWWLLAAHAVHFVVIPQVGRLSDKVGRRPVYIAGAIAAGTWGFFAFPMMNSANYLIIMSAIIIGLVIHAFMYAPQPAIMAEMFPTRMRYSGVSLGYQVTSIVAGSVAPAIATWLLDKYHSSVPIALYLAGAAVVTLVAALFMRETNGIDLASVDQADREELAKAGVV
jgi:MFS family permease